jgi:putative acetyltransferase
VEELLKPEVTFWAVWLNDVLVGCGALKELTRDHGEIKAMHTLGDFRRRGVAARMLSHIIEEARHRNYRRLSLETGSGPEHAAARSLYTAFGFTACGPYEGYKDDPFSTFMVLSL